MTATAAPFGMRPVFHPSGDARPSAYKIDAAYATNIYKYGPCTLNTNGTITVGAAAADFLGCFLGVEYVDSTLKPTVSNFWGSPSGATEITAWVDDNPETVYEMQSNGSIAQTAVGDQSDFVNPGTGSTTTGLSSAAISSSLAGAGVQGQLRIVGFGLGQDNAPGDAFTIVRVTNARSQYRSNKVAI